MSIIKKFKKNNCSEVATIQLFPDESDKFINERVLAGAISIIGERNNQEDSYAYKIVPEKRIAYAVLCDGMGGLNCGEVASNAAVDYVLQVLEEDYEKEINGQYLKTLAEDVNDQILFMKDESGKPLRAGTTLCAVYIREGKMNWISVGDSKIYIFKGGKFICLTNEHNYMYLANMNKDNENFKIDLNARHDALVSFIGAKNLMYIDINDEPLELEDGDVIILCSDGLYKSLHEEDIVLQLFKEENDMQIVVENLISEVMKKANGTQDNTTVVVMKYKNE